MTPVIPALLFFGQRVKNRISESLSSPYQLPKTNAIIAKTGNKHRTHPESNIHITLLPLSRLCFRFSNTLAIL